jgi:glucose-1-phosphate thymidylyltransferase
MKGIILAAGKGTRLFPLTKVTNKELLPVYDKPMIFYPLQTLIDAGITEILIIVSPERAGDFINLLGSGASFGASLTYRIQDKAEGIAQAFVIAEQFIGKDDVALILGDNIFEDTFGKAVKKFKSGAHVFAKVVHDPERFGVVKIDKNSRATKIVEKPKTFISNLALTGFYLYDYSVIKVAKGLKPSARGELEITDVNNWYLSKKKLSVDVIKKEWIDAGTFDSFAKATNWEMNKKHRVIP